MDVVRGGCADFLGLGRLAKTPSSLESVLALRSPEGDAFATLDMRKGGSLEREVNAFRGRVAELKRRGRTCNLSVVTVPLVEEDPLRNFQKQGKPVMEEDN